MSEHELYPHDLATAWGHEVEALRQELAAERVAHEATKAAYVKDHVALEAARNDAFWCDIERKTLAQRVKEGAAELSRRTADCEAKTARLRNAETAFECLMEGVTEELDKMEVPHHGGACERLAWLREHVWQGRAVSA